MGSHDVVERFWSAFEANDLDAAMEAFSDDAVFIQPGMPEPASAM